MFTTIGVDDVGRYFHAVTYSTDCLQHLPWEDEAFDCIVFLCKQDLNRDEIEELSVTLVRENIDWVQVAGKGSELVHDYIDETAVALGLQKAVGDGCPMTTWHEEDVTFSQMAEVAVLSFGSKEHVLVLVVGNEGDLVRSIQAVQDRLAQYK